MDSHLCELVFFKTLWLYWKCNIEILNLYIKIIARAAVGTKVIVGWFIVFVNELGILILTEVVNFMFWLIILEIYSWSIIVPIIVLKKRTLEQSV